ncbi:HeH/LEM domain-containing protein [Globicatella sanguinis]
MAFKVLKPFKDTTDKKYEYGVGDTFPRTGFTKVSEERQQYLVDLGFIAKETEDITKLTVAELKERLDNKGIEYDAKAKKDDLINLLK